MKTLNLKKILVPVDFSDTSMKAFDHAIFLARLSKAEIILLNVVEMNYGAFAPMGFDYSPMVNDVVNYEKNILAKSEELLNKLSEDVKKKGALEVKVIASMGRTHSQIVETAKKENANLIVMGTHGASGFREFVMGSNAYRVVNDAECAVLTIRKHSKTPEFKNILVPFRDKSHSREKINPAIKMAEVYGATIHLLGIDTEHTAEHLEHIKKEADVAKGIIEQHKITCTESVIIGEYDSATIMKYAKSKHADLIVIMSDTDKMSISEFIMGPYSQQIINHSPIPVLSIRPEFNPEFSEGLIPGSIGSFKFISRHFIMIKQLNKLNSEEYDLLIKAPALVSVIIASHDEDINSSQKADAIHLAHIKTFSANPLLLEYYNEVDTSFKDNFSETIKKYTPLNEENRKVLTKKMNEVNNIISKLDKDFGIALHKSLSGYADHVKKAGHSILESFIFPLPIHGITEE